MPLSYAELERFYESLVARARRRGIACGINMPSACCRLTRCANTDWTGSSPKPESKPPALSSPELWIGCQMCGDAL